MTRLTTVVGPASFLVSLVVVIGLLVAAPAHADARIVDVTPYPASVVPAGVVAVRGSVAGVDGVEGDARIVVDGEEAGRTEVRDGALDTTLDLEPGPHTIELEVTLDDGTTASRSWSVVGASTVVRRLAGSTRLGTSIAVGASSSRAGRATSAVLARADAFADGLAGGPLAVALRAPLLLTPSDEATDEVLDALQELVRDGGTVHVLGGTAAVSTTVVRQLRHRGFRVVRHAGADRYATAAAVARELAASDHAWLASGEGFADALAASAPAAIDGSPVLLTPADELDRATRDALTAREVTRVTLAGGPAAVGPAVVDELTTMGITVERVAGDDRYGTAAAIARRELPDADAVVLASGVAFADALSGGPLAAEAGAPVLLTAPGELPETVEQWLRERAPRSITVLGGPAAVSDGVELALLPPVVDGTAGARSTETSPSPGSTLARFGSVDFTLDAAVDAATAHLVVDGEEVPASVVVDGSQVLVDAADPVDPRAWAGRGPVTMDVRVAVQREGRTSHLVHQHVLDVRDPVYATVVGVPLYEPSASIDMIGFHQSSHDGAQDQVLTGNGVRTMLLPSRNRGTTRRGAADIVAEPGVEIVSPATGRVVRGGRYTLYCKYEDNYLVIEPDGHPGIEVKLLHFRDLAVSTGDRVVAGVTRIGSGPRQLPFESQVDRYSSSRWPHVHVEVVDTSIPDRPSGGC